MKNKKLEGILTFLHRANELKRTPRFESSLSEKGDSVAEHSWRLTLMVHVIGTELDEPLDLQKAMAMALIHDLAESVTGDIDAIDQINDTDKDKIQNKHRDEVKAMGKILKGIPFAGDIYKVWDEFEEQKLPEAKFVKALDKIEAYLHLDECGTDVYIPKEFHSDYADKAVKSFDAAIKHFPKLKDLLEAVKEELKEKFAKEGVGWIE